MAIDCSQLFPNSHLHLLVWDRFNSTAHDSAAKLLADLLGDSGLSGNVMPLVRPSGRPRSAYDGYDAEFAGGHAGGGLPPVRAGDREQRLRCCEMWLQVSGRTESDVWVRVKAWAEDSLHQPASAWRSHREPNWTPLAPCFAACDYCEISPACQAKHQRFAEAVSVLRPVTPDQLHWLLKSVWYQGSAVLASAADSCRARLGLDPCDATERTAIVDLLDSMLQPLDCSAWGICGPTHLVDPTALLVSHMTAFAINAATEVSGDRYCLEEFCCDTRLTRPYCFHGKAEYLSAVRAAVC